MKAKGSVPLGAALVAVFAPKCPMCIAGWLTAVGVGASAAHVVAPALRPAAIVVLLGSVGVVAYRWWRRRQTHPCECNAGGDPAHPA